MDARQGWLLLGLLRYRCYDGSLKDVAYAYAYVWPALISRNSRRQRRRRRHQPSLTIQFWAEHFALGRQSLYRKEASIPEEEDGKGILFRRLVFRKQSSLA